MKKTTRLHTHCQIIGFGPASVSLLIAADRLGILHSLLDKGLIIHEQAADLASLLNSGINYDIPSNSDALDFISGLAEDGFFTPVLDLPTARLIQAAGNNAVSLQLVALFIADIRQRFLQLLTNYPKSHIIYNNHVDSIVQQQEHWQACTSNLTTISHYVILASGSHPYIPEVIHSCCEQHNIPLLHTESVLRNPNTVIQSKPLQKPIVTVGSSHSAFSVLDRLLSQHSGSNQTIKIVHNTPIRRMHLSAELAREAGEVFDKSTDICPDSGRVFRFQGLYKRSKRLFEDVLQRCYPFVSLHECSQRDAINDHIKNAGLVIAATGYRPRLPIIRDQLQQPVTLAQQGSSLSLNDDATICHENGTPLVGLMAIGLGFGRKHSGIGEPSYLGAPVGINIFQGADSEAICQQLHTINTSFDENQHEEEFV